MNTHDSDLNSHEEQNKENANYKTCQNCNQITQLLTNGDGYKGCFS